MIYVYQTPQGKNRKICQAFAAGSGGKIVGPYPLQPSGSVFMFGCLRGLLPTLKAAQREGRTWFYGDNGYFKPGRRVSDGGYYRITKNAMQHDGTGEASSARWDRLGIEIKPWRKNGNHIVVCPPARLLAAILGFDADRWLKKTIFRLGSFTKRPIRVRRKMSWKEVMARAGPSLADDLEDAWCLVTFSSNSAVEALIAGVPVFCTAPCAAYRMGLKNVSEIEHPIKPDGREKWAWNLAAAQWTLHELASGQCWRELNA